MAVQGKQANGANPFALKKGLGHDPRACSMTGK
jgi:hypothetical protein